MLQPTDLLLISYVPYSQQVRNYFDRALEDGRYLEGERFSQLGYLLEFDDGFGARRPRMRQRGRAEVP